MSKGIIEEFGVNTVNPNGVKENPFDSNFGSEEDAVEAGLQLLRENPEEDEVVIFRMEFEGDLLISDVTLRTLTRADLGPGKILAYFQAEPSVEYGECPNWICWDVTASAGALRLLRNMGQYGQPEMLSMTGMPVTWHDAEEWGLAGTKAMLQVFDGDRFLLSDYDGQYSSPLCGISTFLAMLEAVPPGKDVALVDERLGFEGLFAVKDGWEGVSFTCA